MPHQISTVDIQWDTLNEQCTSTVAAQLKKKVQTEDKKKKMVPHQISTVDEQWVH